MNEQTPANMFTSLLDLLDRLEAGNVFYRLRYAGHRNLYVDIDLPGGRWEVGFYEDGDFDVEVFVSRQPVGGTELLPELNRSIDECIAERKGGEANSDLDATGDS